MPHFEKYNSESASLIQAHIKITELEQQSQLLLNTAEKCAEAYLQGLATKKNMETAYAAFHQKNEEGFLCTQNFITKIKTLVSGDKNSQLSSAQLIPLAYVLYKNNKTMQLNFIQTILNS